MSAALTLEARAKVNLGLAVLARRGDGYHEVETLLARIDLADTLEVALSETAGVRLTLVDGGSGDGVPVDASNLAARAAEAYLRRWTEVAGRAPGVDIALTKRVPVAAGLGGGSSDAGAVLRALRELLPLPDTAAELGRLAAGIGSDVSFFAADVAFAIARGRGERLAPAPAVTAHLVLVNPGVRVAAAEAYASLVGFSPRLRAESALELLAAGAEPRWHNALQAGVQRSYPEVRQVCDALRAAGLRGVIMSGSGSTCFGVADDAAHAAEVAETLAAERPAWWVRSSATG